MNKYKKYMIISVTILVISIIGSTYALYKKTLSNDIGINTNTPGLDKYIVYEKGNDITGMLSPSSTYIGGASSNIKFYKIDNTYDIYGEIILTINSIGTNLSNSAALKYALVNNDTILSEGSLNGTQSGSKITLIKNLELQASIQYYTIYVWLDINEPLEDISGEVLSISVDCTADMVLPPTLAYKITSLYNNAEKEVISIEDYDYNTEDISNIRENNYNYATSVSLMNDRLGGTTTDYDAGNIRYRGASPNNYIYFNCSDYSNQTSDTCELWRIIGVFNGKVKLIRNESIGELAWDIDYNINKIYGVDSDNDWSTSTLQVLLNEKYYYGDTAGTIAYYSGGMCYDAGCEEILPLDEVTIGLNMAEIGIKNDTTRNMISIETYYLRGFSKEEYNCDGLCSAHPDESYNIERTTGSVYTGRPTSWTGKIALAYPSDIDYAGYYYANWTGNDNSSRWLLSPYSNSGGVMYSYGETYFDAGNNDIIPPSAVSRYVNPVLYLNSDVEVSNVGDGTEDNPYRISI